MDYRKRENFYTVKEVVEHNTSKDILKEEDRNYQFDFGGIPDMIRDHSGKISIISDYDVDGVCCSLILDMILVFLQKDFEVYVPRRETDGYGLSEKILDKVSGTLIITVDNGIVAFDAVKKAKEQGRSVIILDHHYLQEMLMARSFILKRIISLILKQMQGTLILIIIVELVLFTSYYVKWFQMKRFKIMR